MVARWRFSLPLGLGLAPISLPTGGGTRYRTALRTSVPVLFLGLFGCGGGSGGGPTGPTEGTLEVITSTAGSDLDPDGYSLTVDEGAANPLAPNGADTVASLNVGNHTVTLAGIASNCTLGGENPRTVEIAAASMASLQFEIACSQTTGAVQVSAVTTGDDLDPDDYQVALDGGTSQPLLINGSLLIAGLTPGDHTVALSDVADNCVIAGPNPQTVAAPRGSTANAAFSVSCSPIPLAAPGFDIAFSASVSDTDEGDVYLLSADGTTLTNLTNDPDYDSCPAWSPDGHTIAFCSRRTGTHQIYVMNADGSGQTQLTSGSFSTSPRWSPDGTKIAFDRATGSSTEDIFLMNPDGSALTQLTSSGHAAGPVWSPDGTRIAFTVLGGFASDVYIMNADGSDVIQLTTEAGRDVAGSWSPDGTKIYFVSDRNGDEVMLPYAMNPDGTGVTQLTDGTSSVLFPVWSPDGSKIAFSTGDRLYMMNPDGTERVPLTASLHSVGSPAWRP